MKQNQNIEAVERTGSNVIGPKSKEGPRDFFKVVEITKDGQQTQVQRDESFEDCMLDDSSYCSDLASDCSFDAEDRVIEVQKSQEDDMP